MLKHDIDSFEDNIRKLIHEAMNLSRRRLESMGLPQPKGAIAHLLQDAVMSFVGAANVLIGVMRQMAGKA